MTHALTGLLGIIGVYCAIYGALVILDKLEL